MATQNFFALLGDSEIEDAADLIAQYSAPPPVEKPLQSNKKLQQPAAKPQQEVASFPSKPVPPSEFGREGQRGQGRGGRGGRRGGRVGFGERDIGVEEPYPRGSENGFSSSRRNFSSDPVDGSEKNGGGYQVGRGGYQRGRGGYRGGGRSGSYSGYGDNESKGDGGYNFEGAGNRGRGRGRGRGIGRDEDDNKYGNEFDRRSGSGRGSYEPRRGGGRGLSRNEPNLEVPKEEISEPVPAKEENHEFQPQVEQKAEELNKDKVSIEDEQPKVEEEEDKEMTLDEYEKILEEKRKTLASLKTEERKVDADQSFKKMQLVDRKNEDDIFIKLGVEKEKGKKKEVIEKDDRAKKAMNINEFLKPVDGETSYAAGSRGRGRGRGRSGMRGGFGGGFNNSHRVSAPRIEDTSQFPTLGAN